MIIWNIVWGFVVDQLKKLSFKAILITVLVASGTYILWGAKEYLTGMKTSVTELTASVTALSTQNERLLAVNAENLADREKLTKDIKISDYITEQLIEKVEGIQNVKITEKTIIQTAQGNCLDIDYPQSIIDSGVLRWEEETTTSETSDKDTN
jgi:hypothetical protein